MEKIPYATDPERSSSLARDIGRRPPTAETIRSDGFRNIRRMSNWLLAALVVGIGATTGALAAATHSKAVGTAAVTTPVGTPTSSTASAVQGGPTLASPVATTSASGVTMSATAHQGGSPSPATFGSVTPTGSGDS